MLDMILSALQIGSVAELLYDILMAGMILSMPFMLGILYGEIMAKKEQEQDDADERAIAREQRRKHNDYVRDMLRQIEELE